jgi:spore germination cell wall hydrolase CwlJ-like protein
MDAALLCLALAVFVEARGEPIAGQEAVAQVVVNRSRIRGLDNCAVLAEKGQFAWDTDKYLTKVLTKAGRVVHTVRLKALPMAQKGWAVAMMVAVRVSKRTNTLQNVEFFHAKHLKIGWERRFSRLFVVGNHVFYARKPTILASL